MTRLRSKKRCIPVSYGITDHIDICILGRTLAIKGLKHVEAVIQSSSSLTHSYTVMVGITLNCTLLPFYICFQESTKDGNWPPTLKDRIVANMVKEFSELLTYFQTLETPEFENRLTALTG